MIAPAARSPLSADSGPAAGGGRELLRAYHELGDAEARGRLIEQYLPLVKNLARRFEGRGEQLDDLVQVGSIGLIKAVDRFRLDRGVEFATFAIPTILGEIRRHLRDQASPIKLPRRIWESQRGHSTALSHFPTEEEGDGSAEAGSALERAYELSEDRALLAPGLRVLDERERRILHLRFFGGLSQTQIAREMGISQIHVSRLLRGALEKMRRELERPSDGALTAARLGSSFDSGTKATNGGAP